MEGMNESLYAAQVNFHALYKDFQADREVNTARYLKGEYKMPTETKCPHCDFNTWKGERGVNKHIS